MEFAYSPTTGNATFPTWSESFSAPSVAPLTSSSSSGSSGGFDWAGTLTGIGMLGEGIGNAFRAYRGEPPLPGGMLQSYMNQQQSDRELAQLKELFASIGQPAPLFTPKGSEEEDKDKEDEEEAEVKPLNFAYKPSSSFFSGDDLKLDSFTRGPEYTPYPSPRIAGQVLSSYYPG